MNKKLTLNALISSMYEIYRENMKSLILYAVIMILVVGGIGSVVMTIVMMIGILAGLALMVPLSGSGGSAAGVGLAVLIIFVYALVIAGTLFLFQLIAAGYFKAVNQFTRKEKIKMTDLFTFGFKKIGVVFTSTTAYALSMVIVLIPTGIIAFLLYSLWLLPMDYPMWAIVTSIVIVMLVATLSTTWFAVYSLYYLQIALDERAHFFKSIIRSFKLVQGKFWKTFGYMYSIYMPVYLIYMSLGGILTTGFSVFVQLSSDKMESPSFLVTVLIGEMIMMIGQMLLLAIVTPLQFIGIPLLYLNETSERREVDLELKLRILNENLALKRNANKAEGVC